MSRLVFNDNCSGTIMEFPLGMGKWKSGEEREVDDEIAIKLLDAFSCIKEVKKVEIKTKRKKKGRIFVEEIKQEYKTEENSDVDLNEKGGD